MGEALERAARAICIACDASPDALVLVEAELPKRVSIPRWQSVAEDARAAVVAALDPSDDELAHAVAIAASQAFSESGWGAAGRAAIAALRDVIQKAES